MESGSSQHSIRRHAIWGLITGFILLVGIGGWALATSISGAVIAAGRVVVDSHVKKVQHQSGGIIGELRVKEGQKVNAGQIVVRLDDTQTRANLTILSRRVDELATRLARLTAERDDADAIDFSELVHVRPQNGILDNLMAGEKKLFHARRSARLGKKAQFREQVKQLEQQLVGMEAQREAKEREIELVEQELVGLRSLWKKQLIEITKLINREREAARLNGERGQLAASYAQVKGKIAETELQIIQIDQDLKSDVAKEISDVEANFGEFSQKLVSAEEELKRIDIRSPQDGIVQSLNVHSKGAVVSPAEQIMIIVPVEDALAVEVRVSPEDIDQLSVGQSAMLRFSAFSQQTTPQLKGSVTRISADLTQDEKTGQGYYLARVGTSADEINRLGQLKLVPGMPVEAFIHIIDRRVLSYLVKPISDQIARAFRGD